MRKKKDIEIDSEIEKMQAVAEDNGLIDTSPAKKIHKKRIPDRRYWIFGSKVGSDKRETYASISTGETCAVNQFVKAVPNFQIWGVMFECHVDPEKYKDNPVYKIEG